VLAAGDSIYFDSSSPHSYHKTSPGKCSVVVVTSQGDMEGHANGNLHRLTKSAQVAFGGG
jgi:uncharacterized RmlC-like cupin family protein